MSSLLASAFRRLRPTAREFTAFLAVGALAFVVDAAGSNALHFGLGLGPLTAKSLSVLASTLVAYVGNRLWTFRHRDRGPVLRCYALFFALNAVGLAIALSCLWLTRHGLGLTGPVAYNVSANVVGAGLGSLFRYWSYRRWVFPAPPAEAAAVRAARAAREGARPRWQVWRSPAGQPPWARPALLGVAALAALLYTWNISSSGYAVYYAAAVRSMTESWRAFLFGTFDPSATITLDKIGGFLWPQAISARLFGFSAWALTLPQCVMGVVSVLVMYRMVRRWQGPAAGLVAALLLTLTPVVASMFGHAMLDGSLTMCLVLAADQYQRAVRGARLRSLLLAAMWIGLGFHAKMAQAWLIVPALAAGYLAAAPVPLRRRLGQLLAAGATVLAVSFSWLVLMTFTPEHSRPYADGSTCDSALVMVFGFNGVNRLVEDAVSGAVSGAGTLPAAAPTAATDDPGAAVSQAVVTTGWLKLAGSRLAPQIGWLYPLALLALALGLLRRRGRDPAARQRRGGYVMWGSWLLTSAAVFSAVSLPHTAYAAALAPPLAALSAAGTLAMWRAHRAGRRPRALALPAAIALQTGWAVYLASAHRVFAPWLIPLILSAALAGLVALARRWRVRLRLAGAAGLAAGCVAMFAAPATWSLSVLDERYAGSPYDAAAGPPAPGTRHAQGELGEMREISGMGETGEAGGAGPGGADGWTELTPTQRALVAYAERHGDGASYPFSTDSWTAAAPFILAEGIPVLPLGGFSGQARSFTLPGYRELIATGQLRFALLSGHGPGHGHGGDTETARISAWVRSACAEVPPETYVPAAAPPGDRKPETLYDCARS